VNYYERHIGDFIKDTVSLSMLEDGAYNRLIDWCYQSERLLPPDIKEVYKTARANAAAERKAVDYVLAKYFNKTSDGYVQKRIASEIAKYQDKQRKAVASANARWEKERLECERNANASKTHMRTECESHALQTPVTSNQTPEEKKPPTPAKAGGLRFEPPDWVDRKAWADYGAMRASLRKPLTDAAKAIAVRELEKLLALGHDPKAVLEQSVMNSWQGLFPINGHAVSVGRGLGKQAALEAHNDDVIKQIIAGDQHANG
jgi:uncharacterized protein YdaU (DUF1376 family)